MKSRANIRFAGWVLFVLFCCSSPSRGDGGVFWQTVEGADLAQSRQEAVLAVEKDNVTYVIRTVYHGLIRDFAWVIPVPDTPTNVKALSENNPLFSQLDASTRPSFLLDFGTTHTGGCGCAAGGLPGGTGQVVLVEASGKAGIFTWAALTSTGGSALLTWLGDNGYNVPQTAQLILDGYIQQGMHFLAVKVSNLENPNALETTAVPPIQFTVNTQRIFYPMTISQISADNQSEVVLYILSEKRVEASNIPNGQVDPTLLAYDPQSGSQTNYEKLFTQKIADLGGLGLITEYASQFNLTLSDWPEGPTGLLNKNLFLTRMRTLIPRDNMTQDFEFRDAADNQTVSFSHVWITVPTTAATATVGQTLGAALILGTYFTLMFRQVRRR